MLKQIAAQLRKAKNAVLVAHIDPDGDTIGSVIGMGKALESLGCKVTLYCQDPVPDLYRFLPGAQHMVTEIPSNKKFDVGIVLDAGSIKRVGRGIEVLLKAKKVINIDHHGDNTLFGDWNLVSTVSSTAEIVYDVLTELRVKISHDIAQCLMAALVTDTGSFRYDNTTLRTFEIARDLMAAGANPSQIAREVYDSKPLPAMRVLAYALGKAKTSKNGALIWTVISRAVMNRFGARDQDTMGVVDAIRSIKGVEVAVVIREYRTGKVKANLRSKTHVNVARIAKQLGGGGHVRASGVVLEGKLANLERIIIKTVEANFKA